MQYVTSLRLDCQTAEAPVAGRPLHIVHVIRQGKIGGGETYVNDLVRGLSPQHFKSTVVSFTPGPMVDSLRADGYDVRVIPVKFPLHKLGAIKSLLHELQPDLIHGHGTKAAFNFLPARLLARIPYIYMVHGWSFHKGQNPLMHSLRIGLEHFLSLMVTKMICGSYANLHEGKRLFAMKRSCVIQNAISTAKLQPQASSGARREDFGLTQDQFVVLFLSRVTFQKDPLTAIAGFHEFQKGKPDARFLVVGDGELMPEMKAYVAQHNLGDKVVFTGARTDVGAMLSLADIYILPSFWEVLSLALMEAMAAGLPCVCSDLESNKELITHGENGMVFPVGNPEGLAKAMTVLYHDPALRAQMGAAAREIVYQHFTFDRVVATHESMYQVLVQRHRQEAHP